MKKGKSLLAVLLILVLAFSFPFADAEATESSTQEATEASESDAGAQTGVETPDELSDEKTPSEALTEPSEGKDAAEPEEKPAEEKKEKPKLTIYGTEDLVAKYSPVETPLDPRGVNGYKTLTSIALGEFRASDSAEYPQGSDCVKYNTWLYGTRVSNGYENGAYEEKYNWNAAFVSWCAAQGGYTEYGRIPRAYTGGELYTWYFTKTNATIYSKMDLTSTRKPVTAQFDDLIFFPSENDYMVGIITEASAESVTYVMGDVNYGVHQFTVPVDCLPNNCSIVRWKNRDDFIIPFVQFFVNEVGMTKAAAIGLLANVMCESSFNPHAIGDANTSYGLCQWHDGRWRGLVEFCDQHGYDWNTYEGQLQFLKYDMTGRYDYLRRIMNSFYRNSEGADQAAQVFCLQFECPAAMEEAAKYRGFVASSWLFPIVR